MNEYNLILSVISAIVFCAILFQLLYAIFVSDKKREKRLMESNASVDKKEDGNYTGGLVKDESIKLVIEDKHLDKVNSMIDSFIVQASEYYQILSLSKSEVKYLNEKETEEMQKYIYGMVMKNMTPHVLGALKTVYVIKNDNDLKSLLLLRINLHIIHFKATINSNIATENILG